jgi:hypothetical protein
MESPARREVVLGCSVAGVVSWFHGIWRTAGTFQDCKDRDFSLHDRDLKGVNGKGRGRGDDEDHVLT